MDRLAQYRQIIKDILSSYTDIHYAFGDIHNEIIFDQAADRYLVMSVGWEPVAAGRKAIKRVHGCLIHIDIIDEKIWVQRDGTEHGIATELVAAGIPQQQIVLGFRAPYVRPYTEFAVA